jgi:hypothetical protein
LNGCAVQPAKVSDTRWPEAIINTDKSTISNELIEHMASADATIQNITDSMIMMQFKDSNAALAKALFGCVSCPDPYIKVNFILASVKDGTKVIMQYWRVVPQYNGSEKTMNMDRSDDFNTMQESLWKMRDWFK